MVTFTEEILNGKLHFLFSECSQLQNLGMMNRYKKLLTKQLQILKFSTWCHVSNFDSLVLRYIMDHKFQHYVKIVQIQTRKNSVFIHFSRSSVVTHGFELRASHTQCNCLAPLVLNLTTGVTNLS